MYPHERRWYTLVLLCSQHASMHVRSRICPRHAKTCRYACRGMLLVRYCVPVGPTLAIPQVPLSQMGLLEGHAQLASQEVPQSALQTPPSHFLVAAGQAQFAVHAAPVWQTAWSRGRGLQVGIAADMESINERNALCAACWGCTTLASPQTYQPTRPLSPQPYLALSGIAGGRLCWAGAAACAGSGRAAGPTDSAKRPAGACTCSHAFASAGAGGVAGSAHGAGRLRRAESSAVLSQGM